MGPCFHNVNGSIEFRQDPNSMMASMASMTSMMIPSECNHRKGNPHPQ